MLISLGAGLAGTTYQAIRARNALAVAEKRLEFIFIELTDPAVDAALSGHAREARDAIESADGSDA